MRNFSGTIKNNKNDENDVVKRSWSMLSWDQL